MQSKPKLMNFPTPADSSSNDNQSNTEAAPEPEPKPKEWYETLSDEENEAFQNYWAVVDTYRGIKKLCLTHLFDDVSNKQNSEIASLRDRSPIADHYVFYQKAKEDVKDTIQKLRKDGDIPTKAGLREYKANVEPEFEHTVLTKENAENNGVNPETFNDKEDNILFPEAYEFPTDDDGNLIIWAKQSGDELDNDEVLEIVSGASGVGDKTATNVVEALEESGATIVWE